MSRNRSPARLNTRSLSVAVVLFAVLVVLGLSHGTGVAAASSGPVPIDLEAPEVELFEGTSVGDRLSCYPGSWQGDGISFTYEWYSNGTPVASGRLYVIKASDEGHSLLCRVTATDSNGSEWEESYNAVQVGGTGGGGHGTPPKNLQAPEVTGTLPAVVGEELRCRAGEWSGTPTPQLAYQWLRDGATIGSAVSQTYKIAEADEGHSLSCKVTASNGEGVPASQVSTNSVAVKGSAPKSTEAPKVLGPPEVSLGESLTCSEGGWTGQPTPKLTYQWLREGVAITSATANTYRVQEADEGSSLSCEVFATNSEGKASATSSNHVKVAAVAPQNVSVPTVSGEAVVGGVLTCSSGKWTGLPAPTFEYEWLRDGTVTIVTTNKYTVAEADEAHTLVCEVFATNSAGKAAARSEGIVVSGTRPTNKTAPEISGTAAVEHTLTCSPGTWKGVPAPTFSYQWLLNGVRIASASGSVFTVGEEDELKTLSCVVTAKNSAGEAEARASVTVAGTPPRDQQAPAIAGSPSPGQTLTCEPGVWSGSPSPTFAFQWDLQGTAIRGATKETLLIEKAYEGQPLTCEVIATNSEGKATQTSAPVVVPKQKGAGAPNNVEAPSIQPGHASLGSALKCVPGTWSPEATGFAYLWLRDGNPISNATSESYKVVAADEGQLLSCQVTATNSGGATTQDTASLKVTGEAPTDEVRPTIAGNPVIGETLTCETGTWKGVPQPTFAYRWLLNGVAIGGAEGPSFVVAANDAERSLSCEVTASNSEGEASASSVARKVTGEIPQDLSRPVVFAPAHPTAGSTLTCEEGTWSGAPEPSYSFVWMRGGAAIAHATQSTYEVAEADEGTSISCAVTATNAAGVQQATSSNGIRVFGTSPSAVSAPTIATGEGTTVGDGLTCAPGEWAGVPGPTFRYQWLRDGETIPLATSSTYVIGASDIGFSLECEVTASSVEGEASAESSSIEVTGVPPEKVNPPTLEGPAAPIVGDTLECSPGSWSGNPKPSLSYQWLRQGNPIPGATGATYVVEALDAGYAVSCEVIAENNAGSEVAESERIDVPGSRPENVELPSVAGAAVTGETLKCLPGVWNASPTPEFEYQWLLDGAAIEGATANKYVVQPSDLGQTIACVVTVRNVEGTSVETSSNSPTIAARSAHKFAPVTPEKPETKPTVKKHQLTAAEVLAAIAGQLASADSRARISRLIKAGKYEFALAAPAAGTLELSWSAVPAAHAAKKHKPVMVAQATASCRNGAATSVVLRLTSAGRKLIRHSKRIKLNAKGIFRQPGGTPVTWLKAFVLGH